MPFCQLNEPVSPAVVNSPVAEFALSASVVSAVRRVMLPELTLARPVPLVSVTKAYPSTPSAAVVVTARVPVFAELRSIDSVAAAPRLVRAPRAIVTPVPLFGSTVKVLLVPAASVSPAKVCVLPPEAPTSLSVPPPRVSGDDALIEPPLSASVPALTTVDPVNVFAAPSVQVPVPTLVRPPVVFPRMELNVPLPAPANVRPNVAPVTVPTLPIVSAPASEEILAAAARVMRPL